MKRRWRFRGAIRKGFTPPPAAQNNSGSSPGLSPPPPTVLNPRNFAAASSLSSQPPLPQIPPPGKARGKRAQHAAPYKQKGEEGTIPTRSGQVVFMPVQGHERAEGNSPPLGSPELSSPSAGFG